MLQLPIIIGPLAHEFSNSVKIADWFTDAMPEESKLGTPGMR